MSPYGGNLRDGCAAHDRDQGAVDRCLEVEYAGVLVDCAEHGAYGGGNGLPSVAVGFQCGVHRGGEVGGDGYPVRHQGGVDQPQGGGVVFGTGHDGQSGLATVHGAAVDEVAPVIPAAGLWRAAEYVLEDGGDQFCGGAGVQCHGFGAVAEAVDDGLDGGVAVVGVDEGLGGAVGGGGGVELGGHVQQAAGVCRAAKVGNVEFMDGGVVVADGVGAVDAVQVEGDAGVGKGEAFDVGYRVGAKGAGIVGDGVAGAGCGDGEVGAVQGVAGNVQSRAAVEGVVAGAAGEGVVSGVARKGVAAFVAGQYVVQRIAGAGEVAAACCEVEVFEVVAEGVADAG